MQPNPKFLDSNCYPLRPESIFTAINRTNLPSIHTLNMKRISGESLHIPYRFNGKWETLVGFVKDLALLDTGIVVEYPQDMIKSTHKWPDAILWIPKVGSAGILAYENYFGSADHYHDLMMKEIEKERLNQRENHLLEIMKKDVVS